jgi:hypothetical protein
VRLDLAARHSAYRSRPPAWRLALVAGAITAFLLAGIAFSRAIGFLPVGLYTTDYVFLAEGARRIALGQIPHVDYSAPVGPLTFVLLALARRLPVLGPDIFALHVLMWAVVALLAAVVALRLRSAAMALGFLAIAALATLSPFNVEEMTGACDVNYNGIYNRHGAALLFVTFVAGFTPPRSPLRDGALYAWLLAAMLLTKVTYGVAGAAFLALACLFSATRLRALLVAGAILLAAAGAVEAATGMVSGYGRDLAEMARLNAGRMLAFLSGVFWAGTLAILTASALVAAIVAEPLTRSFAALRRGATAEAFRSLEIPALAFACLALTVWTESQSTGGAGLVALSALAFAPGLAADRWAPVKIALATGVVLLTIGWLADQVLRRGWCLAEQAPLYRAHAAVGALAPGMRVPPGRVAAAELTARLWRDHRAFADEAYAKGFDFHLESYGAPVSFVAGAILAHEAAERFRALGLDRAVRHVMTLGFVDDFTPLLDLPPPPGTKLALDPFRTIGELSKEEAAAYLAPIDAAFERTCAAPLFSVQIAGFFRPALEDAFEPIVLTPCWTVHLRRNAATGDHRQR